MPTMREWTRSIGLSAAAAKKLKLPLDEDVSTFVRHLPGHPSDHMKNLADYVNEHDDKNSSNGYYANSRRAFLDRGKGDRKTTRVGDRVASNEIPGIQRRDENVSQATGSTPEDESFGPVTKHTQENNIHAEEETPNNNYNAFNTAHGNVAPDEGKDFNAFNTAHNVGPDEGQNFNAFKVAREPDAKEPKPTETFQPKPEEPAQAQAQLVRPNQVVQPAQIQPEPEPEFQEDRYQADYTQSKQGKQAPEPEIKIVNPLTSYPMPQTKEQQLRRAIMEVSGVQAKLGLSGKKDFALHPPGITLDRNLFERPFGYLNKRNIRVPANATVFKSKRSRI